MLINLYISYNLSLKLYTFESYLGTLGAISPLSTSSLLKSKEYLSQNESQDSSDVSSFDSNSVEDYTPINPTQDEIKLEQQALAIGLKYVTFFFMKEALKKTAVSQGLLKKDASNTTEIKSIQASQKLLMSEMHALRQKHYVPLKWYTDEVKAYFKSTGMTVDLYLKHY